MKSLVVAIAIAFLACTLISGTAMAKKRSKGSSDNKLMIEGNSIHKKGDQLIGASYISGWGSGIGVRYSYFMYDDMHVQLDYAPLSYDYGWGSAEVAYISAAAILHVNWWRFKFKNKKKNGYYFGLGFAQGKAAYKSNCSSSYCSDYELTHDFGGLYWVGGWEMMMTDKVRLQAGYGITGINLGGDFKF